MAKSAQYYAELKEGLGGRTPVFFNVFGFDVGLITAAAVTQSDGSRQGIRDALEKLKDLPAINGPVTYTTQDHTGQDSRSITLGQAGERQAGAGRLMDSIDLPATAAAWADHGLRLCTGGARASCCAPTSPAW